ncbi:tyrosine-type recombinase/integrase [Azospirillum thermophilum]|uniref:Integrase n=1 Tax=Azospirillum thermophilum TaxID=2202148 RepID=A0A2S2D0M4_9PROT|nr:tyrosine-type recombinase/integrase [Azospirillum thermophilum]AWK90311.1 integrase [Azospirillum thermophilum]
MADTDLVVAQPTAPALPLTRVQERILDAFLAGRSARTQAAYQRDLADFAAFVGVADAEEAARRLLATPQGDANGIALAYRAHMLERSLAPATVNRRLSALRSLVQLGNALGLVGWKLEVPNVGAELYRDTRGPGRETVKAMAAAAAGHGGLKGLRDAAIVRLLHDLGLRRGEVVALDIEDLDPSAGTLAVLGKGRRQKELVTVPAPTLAVVLEWVRRRGDGPGPLFRSLDPAGKGSGRLTGTAVYQIVRALGAEVGVRTRPHGLRHTAITTVLDRSGGNIRAAQKFSRHKDVRVLERYDDAREDLAGQMAEMIAGDDE